MLVSGFGSTLIESSVNTLIKLEESQGLYEANVYDSMQLKIETVGREFKDNLKCLKSKNLKVAGYGACATVTTLIHQFDIADSIDFLVDDNPVRQGTLSPGHHIPVFSPASIEHKDIDVIAILAWRFEEQILVKNQELFSDKQILVPNLK